MSYCVYVTIKTHRDKGKHLVNPCYNKHIDKCVDIEELDSIKEKKVYCRCWRSSKFPYCDGSHNEHNKLTGDNVGPIIIDMKKSN
ncbi:unnamed protein product [Protopolystoma xenopodis]|uniref:Iron-binding zinc finger CDGSH type domain-containing protein n=1 Tax=Protopolystoma xenopodis TaxID=117903 RepID=A0A448X7T2_9PLAT|nr:unnamed protein product [Protopolystoma xenopodis]